MLCAPANGGSGGSGGGVSGGSCDGNCQRDTQPCSTFYVTGRCIGPASIKCCMRLPAVPDSQPTAVGLWQVRPVLRRNFYLFGSSGVLSFRANSQKHMSSVSVLLNNQLYQRALPRPCRDGDLDWCFDVDFDDIRGPTTVAVVSTAGERVSYVIPLLQIPSWMLSVLGIRSASSIGSPADFSRSIDVSYS